MPGLMPVLRKCTEPSANRKLHPPGCMLQNTSGSQNGLSLLGLCVALPWPRHKASSKSALSYAVPFPVFWHAEGGVLGAVHGVVAIQAGHLAPVTAPVQVVGEWAVQRSPMALCCSVRQ